MARRGRRPRTRSRWGSVRAKASGNYQASYRHGGIPGVIPSTLYTAPTTFQTEGDARMWLETERRLIETGQWTPPAEREAARQEAEQALANRMTIADYARQWLEANTELRPSTRSRYETSLRYYILAQPILKGSTRTFRTRVGIGDAQLHELTRAQVNTWWQALPRTTHRRSCDLAYNLLRTLCLAAVEDGLIPASPVHVRGAGKPSRIRNLEPLTPIEVLAIADAMPPRWRLGVLLGAWCALRSGEIRELRRSDIDLDRATIRVTRRVVRAGTTTHIGAPKTEAAKRPTHRPRHQPLTQPPPKGTPVAHHANPAARVQPAPEWLSLQPAARLYGISVDTLRRRIATGQLPASRFGQRLIRVRARDLDRLFRAIPTVRPIGRLWG